MPDNEFGVTQDDEMLFAIPLGMGRWAAIDAVISFVDGHCHKIELPGFMTRSGASFGITATFHVVENSWQAGSTHRADIAKWVMVDGLLQTADTVAQDVELLQ